MRGEPFSLDVVFDAFATRENKCLLTILLRIDSDDGEDEDGIGRGCRCHVSDYSSDPIEVKRGIASFLEELFANNAHESLGYNLCGSPRGPHTKRRGQKVTTSKDNKRQKAELLGMPMGTAEKHLRKSIIHELAHQLGKDRCCRCGLEIENPDDLAIIHVQDWEGNPDLYWALTNIAFSHVNCEAAHAGSRQKETTQMRKIEVRVEDSNGNALVGTNHEGQLYVAGKKGTRYQVRVRNKTNKRLCVVVTVDGRNVITGKPGDHRDSGHVLDPYDSWVFQGWRTSSTQVAAFEFGKKEEAYSSQMGSPENVGIIGVAVFEEYELAPIIKTVRELVPVPYPVYPNPWVPQYPQPLRFWYGDSTINPVYGGVSNHSVASATNPIATGQQQALGTGWGEAVTSTVTRTEFKRATESPCEVISIRYDSLKALQSRGIMVKPSAKRQTVPQAFPENGENYCVPPPQLRPGLR